ncbi:MAG: RNA pseudouridine synthase [Treponema sp.]|jgi:23S rRNA pseudouridine1911/1915/1917 synthase|nr:RNA pseudouridine synthase [Treponema sp.]
MIITHLEDSRLLCRGENFFVINKHAGEHPETVFSLNGEENQQKLFYAVHRLDTPVTGCLLFARPPAKAVLAEAFRNGQCVKRYRAIIEKPRPGSIRPDVLKGPLGGALTGGAFAATKEEIEYTHWIVSDAKRNKSIAYTEEKRGGKKALLRLRFAGEGDNYFFVELTLLTGRHHQIRAQLAALGLHIKGDLKYGARRSERLGGIRLHASFLSFPDPQNPGQSIHVKAPPPVVDPLWEAFPQ